MLNIGFIKNTPAISLLKFSSIHLKSIIVKNYTVNNKKNIILCIKLLLDSSVKMN